MVSRVSPGRVGSPWLPLSGVGLEGGSRVMAKAYESLGGKYWHQHCCQAPPRSSSYLGVLMRYIKPVQMCVVN